MKRIFSMVKERSHILIQATYLKESFISIIRMVHALSLWPLERSLLVALNLTWRVPKDLIMDLEGENTSAEIVVFIILLFTSQICR